MHFHLHVNSDIIYDLHFLCFGILKTVAGKFLLCISVGSKKRFIFVVLFGETERRRGDLGCDLWTNDYAVRMCKMEQNALSLSLSLFLITSHHRSVITHRS